MCDDGTYEPCEEVEEFKGSAQVEIEWPEHDPEDLIE